MSENILCPDCEEHNSFLHTYCYNCGHDLTVKSPTYFEKTIRFLKIVSQKIVENSLHNLYLILLFVSIAYFAIHIWLYYFSEIPNINRDLLDLLKDIALLTFSAGIFTCALKYLQYLKVFETEFERILLSDKYTDRIKKSVESITLSEEFFLKQNNLEHIWRTVTLSKYKKEFPEIYESLQNNLKNELFEKNNIEYYYKNATATFKVKIIKDKLIEIIMDTKYTIVRKTKDKFEWDCKISVDERDSCSGKYPMVECEVLNDSSIHFDAENDIKKKDVIIGDKKYIEKKLSKSLDGHKEYHLKRTISFSQNLDNDREYSFSSDRIIDDLTITIRHSDDLDVIFSASKKVNFFKEKQEELGSYNEKMYLNRDTLLPGEKFKLFFLIK